MWVTLMSQWEKKSLLVGMVANGKYKGIFDDSHECGKAIGAKVEDVRSIRITRGGMVVDECVSESQRRDALD